MTTEEILISQFSGQTSTTEEQSNLQLRNGYFVYTSSFGGNLVNEFTVRDFLDNSNNEQLAISFFNYLQDNFTKPQFNELYYDNLKLANTFNDYYDTTVRNNLPPTVNVAKMQLTATTSVTYSNTNFLDYNNRSNELITELIGFNTGDSYYISVSISKSFSILDNQNYDKYRKDSIGQLISKQEAEQFRYMNGSVSVNSVKKNNKTSPQYFLQSFVDINFDDSESLFWTNVVAPIIIPTDVVIENTDVNVSKNSG